MLTGRAGCESLQLKDRLHALRGQRTDLAFVVATLALQGRKTGRPIFIKPALQGARRIMPPSPGKLRSQSQGASQSVTLAQRLLDKAYCVVPDERWLP